MTTQDLQCLLDTLNEIVTLDKKGQEIIDRLHALGYTDEQIEEGKQIYIASLTAHVHEPSDEETAAHIQHLNDFWERKSEICPTCGERVTSMRQVGRCVYCRPCGCRAGQGRLHENWRMK